MSEYTTPDELAEYIWNARFELVEEDVAKVRVDLMASWTGVPVAGLNPDTEYKLASVWYAHTSVSNSACWGEAYHLPLKPFAFKENFNGKDSVFTALGYLNQVNSYWQKLHAGSCSQLTVTRQTAAAIVPMAQAALALPGVMPKSINYSPLGG